MPNPTQPSNPIHPHIKPLNLPNPTPLMYNPDGLQIIHPSLATSVHNGTTYPFGSPSSSPSLSPFFRSSVKVGAALRLDVKRQLSSFVDSAAGLSRLILSLWRFPVA
ncbi:unnamed protein product [Cuscuta epithymum]|uniref:Uncharacterized protein n=1 Tax=Cuscuta epithymum TaxID=186058 RepID=A0AAV0DC20_9ASTE|nr:unnamed protein product [Cuscuta epithymum]